MSTSKNAYEIRMEILKEANSNLFQEYHHKLDAAKQNLAAKQGGDWSKITGEYLDTVKVPTPEDIISYAEKLYKFVSR